MEEDIYEPLVAIPENFNLEEFIQKYPPDDSEIKNFRKDILLYFMGLITAVPARNFDLICDSGYIPLSSVLLQKVAHNYLAYIKYLEKYRVIDRLEQFQIAGMQTMREGELVTLKGKCMGYKFMPKYQTKVRYVPLTDRAFLKRLAKKSQYNTDGKDVYPFLHRWFREQKLNIDMEGAEKFFRQYLGITGNGFPDEKARVKFNAYLHPLRMLQEGKGNFTFTVDETGRRLHNPFTFLKKEAKPFITWGKDKKKLVSLDGKNFQPYLLLGLLNGNLYGLDAEFTGILKDLKLALQERPSAADRKLIFKSFKGAAKAFWERYSISNNLKSSSKRSTKVVPMSFNTPFSLKCLTKEYLKVMEHIFFNKSFQMSSNSSSSIMLVNIFGNTLEGTDIEDINLYRQGVTESTFYPFLKKKFEEELGIQYVNMKDFKEDLMAVFYSKLKCGTYIRDRKKVFAKYFPHVVGFLDLLKSKNFLEKESYKLPVILLQRLEAHLMLDRVGRRIASRNPNLPIFSIHDNWVTIEGYEDFVEKIMLEEITKCIGFAPKIQRDRWENKAIKAVLEITPY